MSIKIQGSLQSACMQRVILTALELGVDYNLYDINIPFGRIPALEEGSIRIFESRAICQ
ncbi:hypothetical protein COCC4DRAFT_45845 [Bipolaris maydis ATCC 48331]|uniref:GST N-terminal domain-containing protein n=1 Tax=Cochliobolus heterostrophus (strain C4 / ATCC 48331 / race T) TaxID=665024 RepID=N4X0E8_COCH4|nr:uncharacterized protein COCC4DRAFT_45845 [Bipolaris maydis ATCC 48331]ENH98711.1 hypothetical protein COCC4DRAFT_45845 [Bipolaris maydis ATCC 48331]